MSQVQVEILCQAMTAQYGTLKTGDILRTDAAFAKHLVEDCGAAKYVKPVGERSGPDAGGGQGNTASGGRVPRAPSKPKAKAAEPDAGTAPDGVQTSAQDGVAGDAPAGGDGGNSAAVLPDSSGVLNS